MPFTIPDLLSPTLALVQQAGIEVMRVYATDFEVSRKADRSIPRPAHPPHGAAPHREQAKQRPS